MKLSIYTPTHDSKFLRDAYRSLQSQTDPDWEWVVLYNNSAERIDFKDERVRGISAVGSPPWVGPLKHQACRLATGDILLELDHDDMLFPEAVAKVKKAFLEDSKVGFVYSNTVHSDMDFKPIQKFDASYGWTYRSINFQGHPLDEHISFEPSPECVSRIWFAPNHLRAWRRSAYEEAGGYPLDMRILDDLDLMCRTYLKSKFHHINEGLYLYRVHGKNSWIVHNAEIQSNVYRIYDQYIEQLVDRLDGDKLDLGGRFAAKPGYQIVDRKGADVSWDLDFVPWPFEDSSVAVIRALDIFEHLKDPLATMKECYRILKPGGWIIGQVPSTDGRGAFQDPTHKSFWNQNSFLYYTDQSKAKYIDTPVRFQAPRLYTTEKDQIGVSWVKFHLVSLKDGYRPCGLISI